MKEISGCVGIECGKEMWKLLQLKKLEEPKTTKVKTVDDPSPAERLIGFNTSAVPRFLLRSLSTTWYSENVSQESECP
jgi:hypothetical protein